MKKVLTVSALGLSLFLSGCLGKDLYNIYTDITGNAKEQSVAIEPTPAPRENIILPTSYPSKVDNFMTIFNKISAPKKDEFTTYAEHRLNVMGQVIDVMKDKEFLVFRAFEDKNTPNIIYNAEKNIASVAIEKADVSVEVEANSDEIPFDCKIYGDMFIINKKQKKTTKTFVNQWRRVSKYEIYTGKRNGLIFENYDRDGNIRIPLSPEEARLLKNNLEIFYLVKIKDTKFAEIAITDQNDSRNGIYIDGSGFDDNIIICDLYGILLCDKKNKKIVEKLDIYQMLEQNN